MTVQYISIKPPINPLCVIEDPRCIVQHARQALEILNTLNLDEVSAFDGKLGFALLMSCAIDALEHAERILRLQERIHADSTQGAKL